MNLKKNVIFLVIGFALGGVAAFLYQHKTSENYSDELAQGETASKPKRVEKVIDTLVIEKPIYVTKNDSQKKDALNDSLQSNVLDSLATDEFQNVADSVQNESFFGSISEEEDDDVIVSEKLVLKKKIKVQTDLVDSVLVEDVLGKNIQSFTDEINVEYWESPLELTGYELNRSVLKLYGFNPYEALTLHLNEKENELVVKFGNQAYILSKSSKFKTLYLK